jgi:hypothetical protein
VPRTVNVTANFAPRNADVQVWVVVPSQKISDHQIIHKNFQPGTAHRLQVTFNQQSKTFDYQLN